MSVEFKVHRMQDEMEPPLSPYMFGEHDRWEEAVACTVESMEKAGVKIFDGPLDMFVLGIGLASRHPEYVAAIWAVLEGALPPVPEDEGVRVIAVRHIGPDMLVHSHPVKLRDGV